MGILKGERILYFIVSRDANGLSPTRVSMSGLIVNDACHEDRFIASSIEFGDGIVSYTGATVYYTVVQEDGVLEIGRISSGFLRG